MLPFPNTMQRCSITPKRCPKHTHQCYMEVKRVFFCNIRRPVSLSVDWGQEQRTHKNLWRWVGGETETGIIVLECCFSIYPFMQVSPHSSSWWWSTRSIAAALLLHSSWTPKVQNHTQTQAPGIINLWLVSWKQKWEKKTRNSSAHPTEKKKEKKKI